MASYSHPSTKCVLVFTILCALQLLYVSSYEFQVGDDSGWVVPTANQSDIYNHWASDKRFKVGDTIRFKYKKDSVMEVREAGYKNCNSTRPKYFSNNGDTVINLDHSGFYYFISGSDGHCEKGQKLIVRVMAEDHEHDHASDDSASSSSAPAVISPVEVSKFAAVQSILLFVASSLV